MSAVYTFKLATYPERVGGALQSGCPFTAVETVPYGQPADIEYKRYTANFVDLNSRPYMLTQSGRKFSTIKAAVAALKRERRIG